MPPSQKHHQIHPLSSSFWHEKEDDLDLEYITNTETGYSWIAFNRQDIKAWLYGNIDPVSKTAWNAAFIYPDFKTAIIGDWFDGELLDGKAVSIKGYRFINNYF